MTDRSDLEAKTRYDPSEVEPRIVQAWLDSGIFHPAPEGSPADNYSVAIPLPNVTGVLHMGHALNNSIQDCLIRFNRIRGRRAKWILGTDHAGIATQTQVERALVAEGSSREQIGREAFVERVWRWRDDYGGQIIEQLKRLGSSLDYDDERFTLDEGYVRAVQNVFVALYEKGYIYRDRYMVNWDPGSRSAISDLEVEDREVTDTLYYIDYPLAEGSGAITIATVRPETMLADVAIAVHPDDDRYRRLVGEKAILPLVGRKLKIIADEYVKPDFGTGALKITPGHDPNDFDIGRRHGLAQISVIGEDGRMTDEAPERFVGMTVEEARREVVAELRRQDLIARTEDLVHEVPYSQRSGERIEPLISLQWFMRMDELVKPAIEVVQSGQVRFWPESYTRVYMNWMENIRPWVISRQLWWGHRIPVWYRADEIYVGTEPPAGEGWEQDPDVLDTWFSSGLFPFAALGWPEDTPSLRAFYPTDALCTGRDIIFLWVARMIMLGIEFTGQIPFDDVYVHSIIQAPDGRRMSKSLGTGVDPLSLIDGGPRPPEFAEGGDFPAYGADAVRWGLYAMSSAQDVRFSEDKLSQGLQLTNKLWNAARLILLGVGGRDSNIRAAATPAAVEDRWILSRLDRTRTETAERIERFDFAHAALGLYDFVYGELCDWYLELVKPRLRAGELALQATLLYVLTQTLQVAHPMIPFVTEEIYRYVPGSEGLLAAGLPEAPSTPVDEGAEASVGRVIEAIQALRGWRDFAGVRPAATLPARLAAEGYEETAEHLERLARVAFTSDGAQPVASVPVPGGAVEILPSDDVDLEGAERRLAARRARLEAEIARAEQKLGNQGFVAKAPPEVVQAERDKLERLRAELDAL
ncbi:MAG TPA: valine--tRNA ligase [Solirubrobacteraceae bacterium]|jgi:valyl-tRNA synthetase|nr:valine--tRNA ligase [Solirubrobacteraceae bacterium]